MSENSRDVLFRLGFSEHPQSSAQLQKVVSSVEGAQSQISRTAEGFGASAINQVSRISPAVKKGLDEAGDAIGVWRKGLQEGEPIKFKAVVEAGKAKAGGKVAIPETNTSREIASIIARNAARKSLGDKAVADDQDAVDRSVAAHERGSEEIKQIFDQMSGDIDAAMKAGSVQGSPAMDGLRDFFAKQEDAIREGRKQLADMQRDGLTSTDDGKELEASIREKIGMHEMLLEQSGPLIDALAEKFRTLAKVVSTDEKVRIEVDSEEAIEALQSVVNTFDDISQTEADMVAKQKELSRELVKQTKEKAKQIEAEETRLAAVQAKVVLQATKQKIDAEKRYTQKRLDLAKEAEESGTGTGPEVTRLKEQLGKRVVALEDHARRLDGYADRVQTSMDKLNEYGSSNFEYSVTVDSKDVKKAIRDTETLKDVIDSTSRTEREAANERTLIVKAAAADRREAEEKATREAEIEKSRITAKALGERAASEMQAIKERQREVAAALTATSDTSSQTDRTQGLRDKLQREMNDLVEQQESVEKIVDEMNQSLATIGEFEGSTDIEIHVKAKGVDSATRAIEKLNDTIISTARSQEETVSVSRTATDAIRSHQHDMADGYLRAYDQQTKAAEAANKKVSAGMREMEASGARASTGIGQVARAAALLGLASSDSAESALKLLAGVQSVIDGVRGGYGILKGVMGFIDGLTKVVEGNVEATKAEAEASKAAVDGAEAVSEAAKNSALSLTDETTATNLLAEARSKAAKAGKDMAESSGGGGGGGGEKQSKREKKGGSKKAEAKALGDGAIDAIKGQIDSVVEIPGMDSLTEELKQNRTVQLMQTKALRSLDFLKGKGIAMAGKAVSAAGSFASGAAGSASAMAAKLGLAKVGGYLLTAAKGFGSSMIGAGKAVLGSITATGAALVAAGAAAAAGLGFAVKSAYEFGKDLMTYGVGNGAAIGSWNDTIANAEVAALNWIGTTTGAFDLVGDAAVKEVANRATFFDTESQMRTEHLNKIAAIELDGAKKKREIEQKFADKEFQLKQKTVSGTDEDKRAQRKDNVAERITDLQDKLDTISEGDRAEIEKMMGQESSYIGKIALKTGQIDTSELKEAQKEYSAAVKKGDQESIKEAKANLDGARKAMSEELQAAGVPEVDKALSAVREGIESRTNSMMQERSGIFDKLEQARMTQIDMIREQGEVEKRSADEEIRSIEKRLESRDREISKIEEKVSKEKEGIQDIISERRKANADAIKSAGKQYVDLNRGERARFDTSLGAARKNGGDSLTKRQMEDLQKVDTEETRKFIEEYYAAKSEELGFADSAGKELVKERSGLKNDPSTTLRGAGDEQFIERDDELKKQQEQLKKEKEEFEKEKRGAEEILKKHGVNSVDIDERMKNAEQPGVEFKLVDRSEVNVKIDAKNDALVASIAEKVREEFARNKEEQEKASEEAVIAAYRKASEMNDLEKSTGKAASR